MKGVILAGGKGERLYPCTLVTNKHLLPVYNKPMIYYPVKTMIDAGVTDIMIITGGKNEGDFLKLLKDGFDFGAKFTYRVQDGTGGIPAALGLAKEFVGNEDCLVILGDNIMEMSLREHVESFEKNKESAKIFLLKVDDPERYGNADIKDGKVVAVYEKPKQPKNNYAIIGAYLFNKEVFEVIHSLKPSERGELEVTDLLSYYISKNQLSYCELDGFWIDAGTLDALLIASNFIAEKERKPYQRIDKRAEEEALRELK